MKSISVSDYAHKRLFDAKNSERKSAEAVINGLFDDNRILKNELGEVLNAEAMILSEEAAKIIGHNLKTVNNGLEIVEVKG